MADRLVLDLSNNNPAPDFKAIAAWRGPNKERVVGVMLKVSEGATFRDPYFHLWAGAGRKNGLRVGGYHFAQPGGGDAKQEAKYFAMQLGKVQSRDFRPALDLEANPGNLSWGQLGEWAREFNREFRQLTGHLPMFYVSEYWAKTMRLDKTVGAALWLASWSGNGLPFKPVAPAPWKRVQLHQFTSEVDLRGKPIRSPLHPDGVSGRVDINRVVSLRPLLAYPSLLDQVVMTVTGSRPGRTA